MDIKRFEISQDWASGKICAAVELVWNESISHCEPTGEVLYLFDPLGLISGELHATEKTGTGIFFLPKGTRVLAYEAPDMAPGHYEFLAAAVGLEDIAT